jgi:hypothetical protein
LEVHNALPEHQFGILGALWASRLPKGEECTSDDERSRGGRRHANLGQPSLGLPPKFGAEPKELAIAFRAVGHVVPARIAFEAVVEGASSQFFEDRFTGTSLPLWIGIIAEDRVLKLALESIELGARRLGTRHQSMTLLHPAR